ncbi:M23 family metallopeptidase [Paenibacillus gansuensis]|uniref:M23 family metallopeptidase n=1 Tax=Paenibacillus gansuensis TaxID=306542 RepID=A0ABW5PER8_9BACL
MSIKWLTKRFTIVLIPGAAASVRRFHLPYAVAYAIIGVLLAGGTLAAFFYARHAESALVNMGLKQQLDGLAASYEQQLTDKNRLLTDKNRQLEEMQNKVIALSRQAGEVKQQVEEMKKLESDLRSYSSDTKTKEPAHTVSKESPLFRQKEGIGGTEIPATELGIEQLSKQAGLSFENSSKQLAALQGSFTLVKQEVLRKARELRHTPNLWPSDTHRITSAFGYREDPFTSRPTFHGGIDFGGPVGSPVYSTADGVVVEAGEDKARGLNIVVEHKQGLRTWYMHLSKLQVEQGDTVQKGQTIGLLGNTGRSTGPHLHYEILVNGEKVDPELYLNESKGDK